MSCKIKFGNKIFNNEEELKAFIANNKEGIKDLLNQIKKETGQQNIEFFTEKAKTLSSKIPYISVLKDININAEVLNAYKIYSVNGFFTNHISKMIPSFQEKQMKVAEAIIDFGEDFLDIGASEGGLVKTIASLNKEIEAIAVDPNKQMQKNYESTPKVNNAKFVFAAFQHSWTEKDGTKVPKFETNNKFGVINEDFTFQFINNNRKEQVKGVKELLKPNGIFITSEKFINIKNYEQNEIKKYEYQSKYFTPEQLKEDKEGIVQDMSSGMVNDVEYFKILKQNFNYVEEFWNVGNFKGFLATDSKETLDFFKQKIGNLDSEFTDFDSVTRTQSKIKQLKTSSTKYQIEKGNIISQIVGTFSNLPDNLKVEVRDELNNYYNDLFKRLNIKDFNEYKIQLEEVGKEKTYPEYTSEKSIYQATIKDYKEDFKNAETTSFRHQINDGLKNMFFKNKYVKKLNLEDNLENRWIIKYLKDYGEGFNLQTIRTKEDLYKALEEEFNKLGDIISTAQGDTIYIEYITEDYINKQIKELKEGELDLEALEMWKSLQNNEEAQEKFVESLRKVQRENIQVNWKTLKYENYPIGMKLLLINQLMYNAHTYKKGDYYKKKRRTAQTHHVAPLLSELFLGELEEKAKFSTNNIVHDYFYIKEQFSKMKIDIKHYEKYKYKKTKNGVWYKFEAKNKEHLEDFSKMSALSEGAGEASWCTGGLGYAKSYLMERKNDMYIFYNTTSDVNNPTLQLAVQNGRLIEVGGLGTNQDVYERDLPDFNKFVENEKEINSEEFINYTRYKKLLSDLNKNRLENGKFDYNRISNEDGKFLLIVKPYYKDSGKLLNEFRKNVSIENIKQFLELDEKDFVCKYLEDAEEALENLKSDEKKTIVILQEEFSLDLKKADVQIKNKKIITIPLYRSPNRRKGLNIFNGNVEFENVEFENTEVSVLKNVKSAKNSKFNKLTVFEGFSNFENIVVEKLTVPYSKKLLNNIDKIEGLQRLTLDLFKIGSENIDIKNINLDTLRLKEYSNANVNIENINVKKFSTNASLEIETLTIKNSSIGEILNMPIIKKGLNIENIKFDEENSFNIKIANGVENIYIKNISSKKALNLVFENYDSFYNDSSININIDNIKVEEGIMLKNEFDEIIMGNINLNINDITANYFSFKDDNPDYSGIFNKMNLSNINVSKFIIKDIDSKKINIENIKSHNFNISTYTNDLSLKEVNSDYIKFPKNSIGNFNLKNIQGKKLYIDDFHSDKIMIENVNINNLILGKVNNNLDFSDINTKEVIIYFENNERVNVNLPNNINSLKLNNKYNKDFNINFKKITNLKFLEINGSIEPIEINNLGKVYSIYVKDNIDKFDDVWDKIKSFNAENLDLVFSKSTSYKKTYLDLENIDNFSLVNTFRLHFSEFVVLNGRNSKLKLPKKSIIHLAPNSINVRLYNNDEYKVYDGPRTVIIDNVTSDFSLTNIFVGEDYRDIVKRELKDILEKSNNAEFQNKLLDKDINFKEIKDAVLIYLSTGQNSDNPIIATIVNDILFTIKEDIEKVGSKLENINKESYNNVIDLYKKILIRIGTENFENLRNEDSLKDEDIDQNHFRHQLNSNKSSKRKAVLSKLYNNIEEYKKVFPTPESFYNDPRSRDRFNSLGITLHDIYKAYVGLDPNKTSVDYIQKAKEVRAKAIMAMKKAGFTEEQVEANMLVFEEYATKWAKKNGRTADEFFVDVISDFQFVDKKDLVPEEQKNASPREQAKAVKRTIWQKIKSFFSKDREGNTTPYEEDKAFEATVEGRTFRRENDKIIRGARKLLNDGTFIIYLTTDARVSTPVHELAHIFENFLTEAERQYVLNFFNHGFWSTKTSEAFARGFEEFLREGQKTDDKILQRVFDKFKEWLTSIFGGIMRANKKMVILNLPMRELYANMFDSKIKDLDRWEEEIETYNKAYNTALDKGGGVQFKKEAFDRILENQFQTPVVGYKSTHMTQVASNVVEYGFNIPEIALRRAASALDAITMGQRRGMTGDPALTIEEAVGMGDALWQIQADISRLRDEIDRNIKAGIDTTYSQTLLEEKLQESELLATVLTFYRSIQGTSLNIGRHFFNASMFSESEIEKEINRINANRRKANKKPLRKKDIRKIKEKAKNLRKLGEALYKLRDYDSKEAYKIRKDEADKYIADLLKEPLFKAILEDLKNYSTEELNELVNKTAQKLNEFYKANPNILYDKEEIDDQIIDENDMLYTLMVATLKEHPEITNVNELYLEMNKLVEDLSENRIVDAVMDVVTWNKNNLSKIVRSNISKVKEEIRLIDKVDKLLLGDLKFAAKPERETTEQIQTLKDIISEIKRLAAVQNRNNHERVEEFQKMFTLLANLENMYEDLLIGNKPVGELTEQDIEQMIKTWNAYKEAAYYYKTGRYPGEKGLIQLYEDRIADLEKDIDTINGIFEKAKGKTIDKLRTVRRSREYLEMVEKYKKDITEKEKRYFEPEVFKLKVRFNKEKREFYELLRNKNVNFWDVFLKELANTPRVMVLAADYSYMMYQGLLLTAKNLIFHPVETIKLISSTFLTSISQSRYDKISKEIMDKDIYYDAWQHGLNVSGMMGASLEEELQLKSVLERLPFFGRWMIKPIREFSERGYNAYMVRLRLNEYARLSRNLDNVLAKETIAEHINTMTGSAQKFWFTKNTNETINNTINMMAVGLIAPRLYASTFKAMVELTTIPDIFSGLTSKNQDVTLAYKRRIINSWQIFTGQIMYILATYALNYAFGSDDDREKFTDVFSSEFMKTHFGERVVTLNPFATYFRFLGRFLAKWVEYSKRRYIYDNKDWKKKTVFSIVWEDFLQYRLNPILNAAVSIFGNVDYTGKMLEGGFTGTEYWTKAVLPNTLPIPISGLVQNIMKADFSREPMESTIAVMTGFALDVFGFNNYITNPIRDNTVANHLKKIKYVYRSHYPDFLADKNKQEIYRRVYKERVQEELGRRLRIMLKKNLKPDKDIVKDLQQMIELEIQSDMYRNGKYNK